MSPSRRRRLLLPLLLLVSVLHAVAAPAQSTDPAALWKAIQGSHLDPARAVSLKKVKLNAGLATLQLDDGIVLPVAAVPGETAELVFLGRGRISLDPPDDVEAGQLELFTGGSRLNEEFTAAVLVVGLDAAVNALLRRPAAQPDADTLHKAEALYAEWKGRRERKILNVDRGLLLDALREPSAAAYFAAWFRGGSLGDFLYQVEPGEREQVSLGRFVPLDATEKEKRKILKEIKSEQKKGRLIGLAVDDLGQWDTWLSASLRGAGGKPAPGGPAFEPQKYTLDVTVAERDLRLSARARLDLTASAAGSRAVGLQLPRDFQVTRVTDGTGGQLFYERGEEELTIILPQAAAAGATVTVVVEYAGSPIHKDWNLYTLLDTTGWYPHAGGTDRAAYDLTFHWPKSFDLVASGHRVDGGETADGMRWERRTLDQPSFGVSFELGHFKIETARAGHVDIRFAFDAGSAFTGRGVREDVVKGVSDALLYYEEVFGPYPLDEMTVATASRGFSQGMLGFVTISDALLNDLGMWNRYFGLTDRRLVIAHEVAHQWWGNLVGWASYRDQWISEAMASYAASLYAKDRLHDKLLGVDLTGGWQKDLTAILPSGRELEEIGPIVLGGRLVSSKSSDAYRAIVYEKGELVLNMLARALGEESFPKALKQIAQVAGRRSISTEDLVSMLEKITAADLQRFASQFIYGTGLPQVLYTYRFEKRDDGWVVTGEAQQQTPHRFRTKVVQTPRGFDLSREQVEEVDVKRSALVVPAEIAFYDATKPKGKEHDGANQTLSGNILLQGQSTPFTIKVAGEPKKFWFDRRSRVFGLFFDENRHPKRALIARGSRAAADGRTAEATGFFDQALASDEPPPEAGERTVFWADIQWEQRALNAQVELRRARLLLDQGKHADAEAALGRAERVLGGDHVELQILQARLEVRRGDYDKAFRRLRKGLTAEHDPGRGESYALLAIAARATGHKEELEKALKKARESSIDVTLLTQPGT